MEVRLQFDLGMAHKLDYCKVFDSNPETTTPNIDRYLLRSVFSFGKEADNNIVYQVLNKIFRDGCLNDLGRSTSNELEDQWIDKGQTDLEFQVNSL